MSLTRPAIVNASALRAGDETPVRRCAPEMTRRAGAACAALNANVALDADAMALG